MKSAKMKKTDEMELEDLKKLSDFMCIGFLVMNLLFGTLLIACKMVYGNIAKVILIISIIISVITFILNRDEKKIYKVHYIYMGLIGSLGALSMYLCTSNQFMPESRITKVLIFLNFILVYAICFYRRIIVKNEKYIHSVKTGIGDDKYLVKDIIANIIISTIIIFIAKILDVNTFYINNGEFDDFISGIAVIGLSIALGVLFIKGIAIYLYRIKDKK
ncbi:hypothetical protein [uncultured Clostridium sp.]|uniref:hypothetical protein n=1 Tax=uncultured Clostridium sp. TaxID=59620 RepID=UPI003217F0D5